MNLQIKYIWKQLLKIVDMFGRRNVFIRHYRNSNNMRGNQETFFPFNNWSNIKGSGIDDKSRINCLSKNVLRKNELEQDVLVIS